MSFTRIRILWGIVHEAYLEDERDESFCCFHVGLVLCKLFFQKALFEQHFYYQIDGENNSCGDAQQGEVVNNDWPDDEQHSQIHGVSDESVRPARHQRSTIFHEWRDIHIANAHGGNGPDPDCHSSSLVKNKQKMVCQWSA